jgi:hypothetical protein
MFTKTSPQPMRFLAQHRKLIGVAAAAATLASGCSDGSTSPSDTISGAVDASTATVIYQFHDASVAPDYHRSYRVTVTHDTGRVAVTTYGKTLHDVSKPIEPALWTYTLDKALEFRSARSVSNDGCSGGTADELIVLRGDGSKAVHVVIDNCGTSGGANVIEAVGKVLPLFDMDAMLATG